MGAFLNYLITHRPFCEVSEMFPRDGFNQLFRGELQKVMPLVGDPEIKSDLERLFNVDFVGYVDRSLRSAGVRDPDLDAYVQDFFVRWLVSPGNLVKGWKRDAPLSFRFRRAVKNAIATLVERASRRRRRFSEMPDDQIQDERPRDEDDLIADFRRELEQRHGAAAVAVFDARLDGRDIKDLVGTFDGIPSQYVLKNLVKAIKASAVRWAGTDPAFQEKVRRLMEAEAETVAKRFGRKAVGAEA